MMWAGSAEEERAPFDDGLDDTMAFVAGQYEYDQAEMDRILAELAHEATSVVVIEIPDGRRPVFACEHELPCSCPASDYGRVVGFK